MLDSAPPHDDTSLADATTVPLQRRLRSASGEPVERVVGAGGWGVIGAVGIDSLAHVADRVVGVTSGVIGGEAVVHHRAEAARIVVGVGDPIT